MSEVEPVPAAERAIRRVIAAARCQFGMEVAFVSEFAGDRRVFRFIDSGADEEIIVEGGGDALEDSFCARVVDGRLPEVLCDAAADPEARRLPATRMIPVGAHLSVPIRRGDGSVFGTFCCFSRTPDLSLTGHDRAAMQMYAALVAEHLRLDRAPSQRHQPRLPASRTTRDSQLRALFFVAAIGQVLLGLCALDLAILRFLGHDVLPAAGDYALAVGGLASLGALGIYYVLWRSLRRDVLDDSADLEERVTVELAKRASRDECTRQIEAAIREPDTLQIVFQPIHAVTGGPPVGHEALCRFSDGRTPDVWFTEAHEIGLGAELELTALTRALAAFDSDGYLSVNLSPAALQTHAVAAFLAASPDTSRLVIEITEHAVIDDYDALTKAIGSLRRLGARLAVDDAGSGFASMRHIVALHPDIVKIDRSLIAEIDRDPQRQALVRSLVDFAHEIHAKVVAEGVERPEELESCHELGLSAAQGFLLGRPSPEPSTRPLARPGDVDGAAPPLGRTTRRTRLQTQ